MSIFFQFEQNQMMIVEEKFEQIINEIDTRKCLR